MRIWQSTSIVDNGRPVYPLGLSSDTFRFFDTTVTIQSDTQRGLDLWGQMYGRFRVPAAGPVQSVYEVLAGQGVMVIDGQTIEVADRDALFDRAYEQILDAIVARIESHILIHAGALSWQDQGIIFPAYSGYGKTTLMLALVQQGFSLLSDEIAALRLQPLRLDPFPRSLRVYPGTLALCGYDLEPFIGADAVPVSEPERRHKLILDIERLRPGALGRACLGRYLIVLSNPAVPGEQPGSRERVLHVIPERVTQALWRDMERIAGVREIRQIGGLAFPVLELDVDLGARVTPEIAQVCEAAGVRLLDVIKGGGQLPDFDRTPRLERLPHSQAAIELIRRFRGGPQSMLLQRVCRGSTVQLFMHVAEWIKDVPCYRLYVGRLDEMVDLVCGVVQRGS